MLHYKLVLGWKRRLEGGLHRGSKSVVYPGRDCSFVPPFYFAFIFKFQVEAGVFKKVKTSISSF